MSCATAFHRICEVYFGTTSPTGFSDPSSNWTGEANAYDGNTGTEATSNTAGGWSEYLTLTHAGVGCETIKVWVTNMDGSPEIDIDVYFWGSWHDLYEGSVTLDAWNEYNLLPISTQVSVTGVESGEHTVIVSADGTNFNMAVD